MTLPRAYQQRLARILADELYGPKLARLNRSDTGHVLKLLQDNRGAEARREILSRDAKRRENETEKRDQRDRQKVIDHIRRALSRVTTLKPVNTSTVAMGVKLMTRSERNETLGMGGEAIRDNAGDRSNIRYASPYNSFHNPWWYH
jgi:hypothetical protein